MVLKYATLGGSVLKVFMNKNVLWRNICIWGRDVTGNNMWRYKMMSNDIRRSSVLIGDMVGGCD